MTEIELEGGANDWDLPVLKIHLRREDQSAGWILVRFPERMDARDRGKGESLRLYKDNRSPDWPAALACEPVGLPVAWTGTPQDLGFAMRFDNGMGFTARARVDGCRVVFSFDLENHTALDLLEVKVDICIQGQHVPDVCDPRGERTVFPMNGRFQPVRSLIPELEGFQMVGSQGHRFYGYPEEPKRALKNPHATPHPGFPDDPERAIYRWSVLERIDAPVIALLSKEEDWCLAAASDSASPVWSNPALSCMHSSPVVPRCDAGETIYLSNTLWVLDGGVDALAALL